MTNIESMDYTHSHPSTIASLSSTAQLSPVSYTYHILPQKSHHTYLSWHFHSHSEIYCHATSIILIMTYITFVILRLHDHVVDIVFVAKPPFIIFIHVTHASLHIPVHRRRHSYRVISCSSFEL